MWGRMFQGGETALQADCGEFDSHRFHQIWADSLIGKTPALQAGVRSSNLHVSTIYGVVAQLGEHLFSIQEVAESCSVSSTTPPCHGKKENL